MEQWRKDARREAIIVDPEALVPQDHLLRKRPYPQPTPTAKGRARTEGNVHDSVARDKLYDNVTRK